MRTYYTQKRAQRYNRTWRSFSEKTLIATISLLDITGLQQEVKARTRPIRILDVACGVGLLLSQLAHLLPGAELYGVDASEAMLTQAADLLGDDSHIHLVKAALADGETAGLPYTPAFFDLITCTNSLHYFADPLATLQGLRRLLVPEGEMVIEDYVLRGFPLPWRAFEWAIKLYDPQHIRLYTCSEAQMLCRKAQLQVVRSRAFPIDVFCEGWAMLLGRSLIGEVAASAQEKGLSLLSQM